MKEPPWTLPNLQLPSWYHPPGEPKGQATRPGPFISERPGPEKPPRFDLSPIRYDGNLMGVRGDYPSGTPLSEIRGVRPQDGGPVTHTILFVNGIANEPQDHYASLQGIADRAGAEVVGIYNATEGWASDLLQCVQDKLGIGRNPAVDTLAATVFAELKKGDGPINLMAHSQGGIITSRALGDVKNRLLDEGMSREQAEATLARVQVQTFGAAAWDYPDGPKYTHHVNDLDPVPNLAGRGGLWGVLANPLGLFNDGGEGAQTKHHQTLAGGTHTFQEAYLSNWQPSFPQGPPR